MSQQQTVLRVQTNIPHPTITGQTEFTFLDLYSDIPIRINKSFSELQDISKKNSDYSIGLSLPGSKKNNQFFESFFNVDSVSLYFNSTKRVACQVLLNDQSYFRGYLRLNKVSVINSKVEYDVTLYSSVGDLFGKIGNNLLKDLNFDDTEFTFNHTFSFAAVGDKFAQSNFFRDSKYPYTYFYPIVHNGYNYQNISGATLPDFTGLTVSRRTRLYTPTSPISGWTTLSGATAAGVQQYRINSPTEALYDNQLKPALNVYSLIQLIFKTYGYEITSDFFNTPWFKGLYLYGYYSSSETKFGYQLTNIETLPLEGCELIFYNDMAGNVSAIVCKKGTGVPCYCLSDIYGTMVWNSPLPIYFDSFNIYAGTSGYTAPFYTGKTFSEADSVAQASNVSYGSSASLKYFPAAVGDSISYFDGDQINFNLVIDQNIKQIDLLSSIAKKFDLIFIPDPDYPNKIKIEPYDFYVGTGTIYDWTPKLSWDKGFTVEPALNYIESTLELTDLEDGDEGNREFKISNNRIYGRNIIYNPTDFKSQDKKIDTIFSPELIRQWDTLGPQSGSLIGLPLGINYSASSEVSSYDNQVRWIYKGVKSKPKLFYWGMGLNPFIDSVGEVFDMGVYNTYTVKLQNSTGGTASNYDRIPAISHTMPIGLSDQYKINNDSLSILFNSEQPVQNSVPLYDVYTENDVYNIFYNNRITNLYDPNTRFISGYFDLKYSDIQNLRWNDIIKINEQYFTINKISEFNLTNRELTKVELIQFNVNPQEYPTRYFKYQYCDQTGYCYQLKTEFTNDNLQNSNFIWSLYYDNQVGSLTGQTSGFTAAFRIFNPSLSVEQYIPYSMTEINKEEYEQENCYNWKLDPVMNYIYSNPNGLIYSLKPFWENSGYTKTGVNVWNNCSDFYTTANTYGIRLGNSQNVTGITVSLIGPQIGLISRSYDYGYTWDNITSLPSGGWDGGLAVSSNGQYQTFARRNGLRYVSNDFGLNYTSIPDVRYYNDVTMSTNGQYQYVCASDLSTSGRNYIYRSTDYGATWSSNLGPLGGYFSIDCNSSGQRVMALSVSLTLPINGFIATSDDYGVTWSSSSAVKNGKKIRISNDSKYVAIASEWASLGGGSQLWPGVYVSSNSGSTYTQTLTFSGDSYSNSNVSISSSGQYMLYAGENSNNYAYLSNDYGVTWSPITAITPNSIWRTCGVSPTGQYMMIYRDSDDSLYHSSDYGINWVRYNDTGINKISVSSYWITMN